MIIGYHNICPHCKHVNKVDILLDEIGSGKGLVTCEECSKLYVFLVSTKKVED